MIKFMDEIVEAVEQFVEGVGEVVACERCVL